MFLIFLGIFLLQLDTPFKTISAIEISGVLFVLFGITGIGDYMFKKIRHYWTEHSVPSHPTTKPLQLIDSIGSETEPMDVPQTICPVCHEKYPESTIHEVCIMCGSSLDSDRKK